MAAPTIVLSEAGPTMKKQKAALSETLKQEFKKDLELFEYFLVLLNSSSPIRNVELMWADDLELFDPGAAAARQHGRCAGAIAACRDWSARAAARPARALIFAIWCMASEPMKKRPVHAVISRPRNVAAQRDAAKSTPATSASLTSPCPSSAMGDTLARSSAGRC